VVIMHMSHRTIAPDSKRYPTLHGQRAVLKVDRVAQSTQGEAMFDNANYTTPAVRAEICDEPASILAQRFLRSGL